ncbi:MAG TPA: retropepsin-like aspartic protease, partial [Candidatus Elarobacter sp.]|nr:retropepsin-like aspartic protease [Candidatus Elarobacter sp.]
MLGLPFFVAALVGASASHPPACAPALFAGVRTHTGGDAWERAKELVADGDGYAEGLPGRTHFAVDLASGARATTDDLGIAKQRIVTSPAVTWKQDITQGVHRLDAPDALAKARSEAYIARNGWFQPTTDPASFTCLSDAVEDGRPLRVVRVVPRGGRPVTVWVDPVAHVVVRTEQQAPTQLEAVHYGAYRSVQGLLLPHEIIETNGLPEETAVRSIRTYRVLPSRAAADFVRPAASTNQRILNGAAFTQVPADDSSGSPVVDAYVDGHGPLPFILDTGGHAILTADAAKELGLTAKGGGVSGGAGEGTITQQFARVRNLRIGDAEITDFPMFVIPYDKSFSNRGPGKTPLAGILGLEVFERFAVTVDYVRHTLRLESPQRYVPPSASVAVPLVFQDDMPLTYA